MVDPHCASMTRLLYNPIRVALTSVILFTLCLGLAVVEARAASAIHVGATLCGRPRVGLWQLQVASDSQSGATTEGRPYMEFALVTQNETPAKHGATHDRAASLIAEGVAALDRNDVAMAKAAFERAL